MHMPLRSSLFPITQNTIALFGDGGVLLTCANAVQWALLQGHFRSVWFLFRLTGLLP